MDDGTADADQIFTPSAWPSAPRNTGLPLNAEIYAGNKGQPLFTSPGVVSHTNYNFTGPPQFSSSYKGYDQVLRAETIEFLRCWLRTHPYIFPKNHHVQALSVLTEMSTELLNAWFAHELRREGYFTGVSMSDISFVPSLVTQSESEHQSFSSIRTPDATDAGQWATGAASMSLGNNTSVFDSSVYHTTQLDGPHHLDGAGATPNNAENLQSVVYDNSLQDVSTPSPRCQRFELDPGDGIGPQERRNLLAEAAEVARDFTALLGNRCRRLQDDTALKGANGRRWQCTRKCGKTFSNKKNWRRHEENGYPQYGWTCAIGKTVLINGLSRCAYCLPALLNNTPLATHADSKHRSALERCASSRQRARRGVFTRYQHLVQHFTRYHPGLDPQSVKSHFRFTVVDSAFPRECGFCETHFTSWESRLDHISHHFEREHRDMQDWQEASGYGNSDFEDNHDRGPPDDDRDEPDSEMGSDDQSDSDGDRGPGAPRRKLAVAKSQGGSVGGGKGRSSVYGARNIQGFQEPPSDEKESASDSSDARDSVWSNDGDDEEDAASIVSNEPDVIRSSPLGSEVDESDQMTLARVQQWRARMERTLKAYDIDGDILGRIKAANRFDDRGKHPLQRFRYGRETVLSSMPEQKEQQVCYEKITET